MVERKFIRIGVVLGILAFSLLPVQAHATTLKHSTTVGSSVTGSEPGSVLWIDYADYIRDPGDFNLLTATGDTLIRLINPNGAANGGLPGEQEHPVCAMIYVFDSFQEMEECCGCPITSAGMLTLSVDVDLTDNLVYQGDPSAGYDGVIGIVAAAPNVAGTGCDPTAYPGYGVSTDNYLLGSRTLSYDAGLTEIPLHDDALGDAANLTYLQAECGALVGNGSGAGTCSCPDIIDRNIGSL